MKLRHYPFSIKPELSYHQIFGLIGLNVWVTNQRLIEDDASAATLVAQKSRSNIAEIATG